MKSRIEAGSSLAYAFRHYPAQCDNLYCNLVAAGESSGMIDAILDRLATYKEKILALKSKIKAALFYPSAVVTVAIVVVWVIMIFVIPAFKDVFSSFGASLPAPTQLVIDISDFVVTWWWAAFLAIGGAIFGMSVLIKRSETFRYTFDRLLLKFPVIGDILEKATIARWTRTLATMFAAGVPLAKVLTVFALLAVLTGGAFSWFASPHPDGLEWAIERVTGRGELSEAEHGVAAVLRGLQEKTAFLPDYGFKADAAEPAPEDSAPAWPGSASPSDSRPRTPPAISTASTSPTAASISTTTRASTICNPGAPAGSSTKACWAGPPGPSSTASWWFIPMPRVATPCSRTTTCCSRKTPKSIPSRNWKSGPTTSNAAMARRSVNSTRHRCSTCVPAG